MMAFKRYEKETIEPFAISVVSKSFNSKYAEYIQPKNTDNFDFVSPDGKSGVEVVTVLSENERNAYVYEKLLSKGNQNLSKEKVKQATFDEGGRIQWYYGGSLQEIIKSIKIAVETKDKKAKNRKIFEKYESIDLCVCVQDGSLMDLCSYQNAGFDFENYVFDNIFFITPSYFLRYSASCGFEEYPRIV